MSNEQKLRWHRIQQLFAVVLIGVLIWWVDPTSVLGALTNITWPLLALLIFISVVLVFVSVLKWKILISSFGTSESLSRLFSLYLVGFFVNLIFPSYLGGDAVRSYYLGKKHGQHEALSATAMERYSGLVAMLILAWVFMWQAAVVTPGVRWAIAIASGLLFGGTLFVLSPWALRTAGCIPVIGEKLTKHGALVQEGILQLMKKPALLFEVMTLSFLFHTVTVVNVMAAAWAVGWHTPPPFEIFVVLPIILIISAIPITPQGIGVQEGAFVYYLTLLGATPAEALGLALILRAKAYLLAFFGGFFWLAEGKRSALSVTAKAN